MALQLFLAITGMFLKADFVPPGDNIPIIHCMQSCYYNNTCTGLFYKRSEGICYLATFIYSMAGDQKDYLETSDGYLYYEWSHDSYKDDGWHYYRPTRTCFKLMDEKLSQADAEIACTDMNSSLINLPNIEKSVLIRNFAKNKKTKTWTAGIKVNKEWKWGNGDPVVDTDWKGGKAGKEDCIAVLEGGWETNKCNGGVDAYICEKPFDISSEFCHG